MNWIKVVDESLFIQNGHAVFTDQYELGVRNHELLTIRRSNRERTKPTAQPLLQLLYVHT